MAILESHLPIIGSIDNLSFYRVRGSDKIVVRRKGGPSRKAVLHSKKFHLTRLNNSEFKGRALASSLIWQSLYPFHGIHDYGVASALHTPLTALQKLDSESAKGRRHLALSKKPMLLAGINLNRKHSLDDLIRTPLRYSISAETGTAVIEIPELIPGLNSILPYGHPFFRIVASFAFVPDVCYTDRGYSAAPGIGDRSVAYHQSPWLFADKAAPASEITLTLKRPGQSDRGIYMLSAGVRIGRQGHGEHPADVKYAGAAKVLSAVSCVAELT